MLYIPELPNVNTIKITRDANLVLPVLELHGQARILSPHYNL